MISIADSRDVNGSLIVKKWRGMECLRSVQVLPCGCIRIYDRYLPGHSLSVDCEDCARARENSQE